MEDEGNEGKEVKLIVVVLLEFAPELSLEDDGSLTASSLRYNQLIN